MRPGQRAAQKKWFQVIRFPALPTAVMHGTEHRVRERRTIRRSTPPWPVSPASGSMLPGSPQPYLSNRTADSQRPFARPQRLPLSRPPFRGQSSRPTASPARQPLPRPVRLFGSTTAREFLLASAVSSPRARCRFRAWLPKCFPASLHSPSGLLPPSGSKRSTDPPTRRPAFRTRPISACSPQPKN